MPPTPKSNYRLDAATKALLAELAADLGLTETAVVTMAVRELARSRARRKAAAPK